MENSKFLKDLTGRKFGFLFVESLCSERTKEGRAKWICKCDCGEEKIIIGKYLLSGETTGCGCTLTRHLRAKAGNKNSNWKGGKKNRGSVAWANSKITDINKNSEKLGYSGTTIKSEELITILNESEGKCNICGKLEDDSQYGRNHIDHCHNTGKVRGMLCSQCNLGIGTFKDSLELLTKAIEYLRKNCTGTPPALA